MTSERSLPSVSWLTGVAAVAAATLVLIGHSGPPPPTFSGPDGEARAESAYANLPLAFEPNAGREASRLLFSARSASGTVFLTRSGATLAIAGERHSEAIALRPVGADLSRATGADPLPGAVNDLRGNDRSQWRTEIPTYGRVRYESAYPGVDLDFYGNARQLEYDFRLAPGADPSQLGMRITGADSLRIAGSGDLMIRSGGATFRQQAPVAYQPGPAGSPTPVHSAFALRGDTVGFRLGSFDRTRPLVIDPLTLVYSTYVGGDINDGGSGIAVDGAGSAYVAGTTDSTNFNTVNQIEADEGDAKNDVFVLKLNPAGNQLTYSTYIGGGDDDIAFAIAVDGSGSAYVTGQTTSTDYNIVGQFEGDSTGADVFVSKLTPAGSGLAYSTYIGGGATDVGNAIAVDGSGAAYVAGATTSVNYDTTAGAFQTDQPIIDAFVTKLTPAGNQLAYSTYLGGGNFDEATGIAVDGSGAAYVVGGTDSPAGAFAFPTVNQIEGDSAVRDAFITKLNPTGTALTYSTYLGGDANDEARAIALDGTGSAYVTGETDSGDFNTAGPIEGSSAGTDVFVSKLTPAGSALSYSTYLGGNDADVGRGIAIDGTGSAYITGATASTDFDTVGPYEGSPSDGGQNDIFVSKLVPTGGALAYSTYLGGNIAEIANAIAVDAVGSAYVTGSSSSTDFDLVGPVEPYTAASDAVISKLDGTPPETTIDSGPADGSSTNDPNPSFALGTNEAGSTFACSLDGAAFATCSSPNALSGLADGPHTLAVRATDSAGNTDQTPASRAFTVDTVAPETAIDSGPAEGGTTTDATPIFAFNSSEADSTFACSVDGAAFVPCASPDTLAQLLDGQRTFTVMAIDKAGNQDPTPAVRTFRVDATPPNGTITKAPKKKVKTTHNKAKVSFTFVSSEPGSSFMCSLDGIAATPCNSPKTYKVGKGKHHFELLASDPAHNPDLTPATVDFKIKRKRKH